MALRHTYEIIRNTLPVQVQGACGLYSFYYAARLLRATNARLPAVPTPRKSEAVAGVPQAESLRKYAKRELRSGQGEILTEDEMVSMVRAWRYDTVPSTATTAAEKKTFLVEHTSQGRPVLIAFLARAGDGGVVPNASQAEGGAHWSVVVGIDGDKAIVIDPNTPSAMRNWALDGLLRANELADTIKFPRYYAKLRKFKDDEGNEYLNGIEARSSAASSSSQASAEKLYDLGGADGLRHTRMKLTHVMIAIQPSGGASPQAASSSSSSSSSSVRSPQAASSSSSSSSVTPAK